MTTETRSVRRTQQERRNEAERALLDAAEALIVEQGIVQTSLAQIGERAGYSRGLVNHHFGTKDGLIVRLVERARSKYLREVDIKGTENGLDTMLKGVHTYFQGFESAAATGTSLTVMWGAALPADAQHLAAIAESDASARRIVASDIQRGQEDGSIAATVDGEAFAVAYVGILRGVTGQLLIAPEAIKARRLRVEIERFVRASLAA